jgi:excinuclease ABC subunit B
VTPQEQLGRAIRSIQDELRERLSELKKNRMDIEAQRLESRTCYDIEMLEEMGYCSGIENYSRHLTGRAPGAPPPTLLEYFPSDFLLFIDESHVTVPQVGGMYRGDRSRKETLVKHGFRLPSALDNRPLNFPEFESFCRQTVYVSATPGKYEMAKAKGRIVEQIIRPTGLTDPNVIIRPAKGAVDDLCKEIRAFTTKGHRVLVTTLTKRMAEDLTEYYQKLGVKVQYLHSDIDTIERVEIIRQLRMGVFDVLVGINLLREGLDIPECALVGILDADKEGFLRSETSLTQTIGRAARNIDGTVVLYADAMTQSMEKALAETKRRREIQEAFNRKHNITPQTVRKNIQSSLYSPESLDYFEVRVAQPDTPYKTKSKDLPKEIQRVEKLMRKAAQQLQFERAAELREQLTTLKRQFLELSEQA